MWSSSSPSTTPSTSAAASPSDGTPGGAQADHIGLLKADRTPEMVVDAVSGLSLPHAAKKPICSYRLP